jgi:hypothetical protein
MKTQALIEKKENMAMNIIKKGKGELFIDPDRGTSDGLEVLTNA